MKGKSSFLLLEGNDGPCRWAELGTPRWGLGPRPLFGVMDSEAWPGLPGSSTAAASAMNSRRRDQDVVQMASGGRARPFISLGGSDKGIFSTIAY